MRSVACVLVTTLVGCGSLSDLPDNNSPDAAPPGDGGLAPPARGFQIVSPTVDLNPGADVTYCYYFETPNTSDMAIKKWASHLTAGGRDLILFLTPPNPMKSGSLLKSACAFTSAPNGTVWTYSAQDADAEVTLPADDGNGTPVGQLISASRSGFLQMHFVNTTNAVIHDHVELNAYAYDEGIQVTQAAPYVAFNTKIDLSPAASALSPTTGMVNGNCNIAPTAKFTSISTHTHKQGVRTVITDGTNMVFDNMSWDHPMLKTWSTAPFYSFTSGKLTYQCEYVNPNGYRIQTGDNAATDEMCLAVGYYFPAAGSDGHFCLNSTLVN
jgi:hypothetical protein